jgi:hypothetical protein
MIKYFSIFTTLFCTLALFSCQKKESRGFDNNQLNISIVKPIESQIFQKGDTIFIAASAEYLSQLHGYSLNIVDTTSKKSYFNLDDHLHDSKFNIETFWVNTLNENAILRLQLTVEADHDGHQKTKEVIFKVTP